ncbi:MAG: hypothetical protein ACPIOQ_40920, partial [Promethearchaeia archaeon]
MTTFHASSCKGQGIAGSPAVLGITACARAACGFTALIENRRSAGAIPVACVLDKVNERGDIFLFFHTF